MKELIDEWEKVVTLRVPPDKLRDANLTTEKKGTNYSATGRELRLKEVTTSLSAAGFP